MSGEFFLFFFGQCRFFAFRAPLGEFKGIHFLIIFRSSQNAANNICSLSVATDLKQLEALKVGPWVSKFNLFACLFVFWHTWANILAFGLVQANTVAVYLYFDCRSPLCISYQKLHLTNGYIKLQTPKCPRRSFSEWKMQKTFFKLWPCSAPPHWGSDRGWIQIF